MRPVALRHCCSQAKAAAAATAAGEDSEAGTSDGGDRGGLEAKAGKKVSDAT